MSDGQYVECVSVPREPLHPVPEVWQAAVDALVTWYDDYVKAYALELDKRGVRKPRLFGYAWNTGRVILQNLAQSCTPPESRIEQCVMVLDGFRELAAYCGDGSQGHVIRGWPHDIYDQLQRVLESD